MRQHLSLDRLPSVDRLRPSYAGKHFPFTLFNGVRPTGAVTPSPATTAAIDGVVTIADLLHDSSRLAAVYGELKGRVEAKRQRKGSKKFHKIEGSQDREVELLRAKIKNNGTLW